MSFEITVADFKDKFDRGQFTYGTTIPAVRDKDIEESISEALLIINSDLYPSDNDNLIGKKALLYLSAHYLELMIRQDDGGGQADFAQSSRSVGSVSESLSIPQWMQDGAYSFFIATSYGVMFLNISKPYLDGAAYCIIGGTNY